MAKRKVLVTGAAGYVAAQVVPALRQRFDCRLVDARPLGGPDAADSGFRIADLSREDYPSNAPLFAGIDTVVHLAYLHPARRGDSTTAAAYLSERVNVDMAFHVYQLSLEAGVRRVVMASSNHAADWYEGLIHSGRKDIVQPWERAVSDNFYGWAKEAYEHLGFVYAAGRLGRRLEVVQVRIGAPRPIRLADVRGDLTHFRRDLGAYVSPRDLTQLLIRAIETPDIRDPYGIPFQIFYGISDNTRKFWSIANAREVLGYAPEDDSEVVFADEIREHLLALDGPLPPRDFNPGPGTA